MSYRLRRASVISPALCIVWLATALAPSPAAAHGNHRHKGDIGLGLVVGQPTGITVQLRNSYSTALNLAVGLDIFDGRNGYAHLDYTVAPFSVAHNRTLIIPFYLGLGALVAAHDGPFPDDGDVHVGARVPLGLAFEFAAPVHIFLELALNWILIDTGAHDTPFFDWGGALGFRVFF
ncbi:MAG: hypothetical protein HYZ27_04925 [Deltaproteobacteria bacterium]|nr:hypothetical protein [Deltaproteobacteria bacterium]